MVYGNDSTERSRTTRTESTSESNRNATSVDEDPADEVFRHCEATVERMLSASNFDFQSAEPLLDQTSKCTVSLCPSDVCEIFIEVSDLQ